MPANLLLNGVLATASLMSEREAIEMRAAVCEIPVKGF